MAARTVPVSATRATSDKITASAWNAGPVASNAYLTYRPDFSNTSTGSTITNNTLTAIPMSQVPANLDSDAGWSQLANTKYTCQVAGWYMICAIVGWHTSATGQRQTVIRKNGADIQCGTAIANTTSAGDNGVSSPTLLLQLAAGDYVEVWGLQNSGAGLGQSSSTLGTSCLNALWISS